MYISVEFNVTSHVNMSIIISSTSQRELRLLVVRAGTDEVNGGKNYIDIKPLHQIGDLNSAFLYYFFLSLETFHSFPRKAKNAAGMVQFVLHKAIDESIRNVSTKK